eukprot:1134657-Rhodomonas_salina.1
MGRPISLQACNAKSGTDIACAGASRHVTQPRPPPLSGSAGSILRSCYAVSSTRIAYGAMGLRYSHRVCRGTGISLCACYAMSDTHVAYAATQWRPHVRGV